MIESNKHEIFIYFECILRLSQINMVYLFWMYIKIESNKHGLFIYFECILRLSQINMVYLFILNEY